MATKIKRIEENQWEMIANEAVDFQVVGEKELRVCESAATPTKDSIYKIALPKEIYSFIPTDGKLFGYSPDGTVTVAYDEVG